MNTAQPLCMVIKETGVASGLCVKLSLYMAFRSCIQNERVVGADAAWLSTGSVVSRLKRGDYFNPAGNTVNRDRHHVCHYSSKETG